MLFTYVDASKGYPRDVIRVWAVDVRHADTIALENASIHGKRWSILERWSSFRVEENADQPEGAFELLFPDPPIPIRLPSPTARKETASLARLYMVWLDGRRICFYCGLTPKERSGWVREHIHPKSRGGRMTVTACGRCDKEKKDYTLDEFRYLRGVDRFFGETVVCEEDAG